MYLPGVYGISYAKRPSTKHGSSSKKSIELVVRKRCLLFARAVQSGGVTGGGKRPAAAVVRDQADLEVTDLNVEVFRAIEGSTRNFPLVFGVETA